MKHVDVAIFGGGPAGALTAALLCRQNPGIRVAVLEKERFPRHHVGEVTLPGWAAILERAGALEALDAQTPIKKLGVIFSWGPKEAGEIWTADFRERATGRPAPGSWHVDRAEFDRALLDNARNQGAAVVETARVTSVEPLSGPCPPTEGTSPGFRVSWESDGETASLTAEHVVDATGQARLLARLWGLPVHGHPDMNNYALYGYWRKSGIQTHDDNENPDERWALIVGTELGWVWHIPIGPDLVSVGVVTDRDTIKRVSAEGRSLVDVYTAEAQSARQVDTLLAGAEYLGDRPEGGRGPEAVAVIQDWSYRVERRCGPGWFLAGDASVFVDPVLSSGMTLASNAASAVANAITTLRREPTVDRELLRRSVEEGARDLSLAYHRMARVWYARNLRMDTWHWTARQERIRTSSASAMNELEHDAFTAVVMGAIDSPLDAAAEKSSRSGWATEFFTWITADKLFSGREQSSDEFAVVDGSQDARQGARRSVMNRWRRLLDAKIRPKLSGWSAREGYHTTRFIDHWARIKYLEVQLDDDQDTGLRPAFPVFDDHPEGLLPYLDGEHSVREVVEGMLSEHRIASDERDYRIKAITECLLHLDMLGRLEVVEPASEGAQFSGHPFLSVFVSAVLGSLDRPAAVTVELDWLGECAWARLDLDGEQHWLRAGDVRRAARRLGTHTATTGVTWARGTPWVDEWVERVLKRLKRLERGAPDLWDRSRELAARGMAFDYAPGEPVIAKPL